ncbi:MAG: hypothetical protein PGN33_20005 [Methylobacterium radiotolerans]
MTGIREKSTAQTTPVTPQEEANLLLIEHQAKRAERTSKPVFVMSAQEDSGHSHASTARSEPYQQLGVAGREIMRHFFTNMLPRPDIVPPAELHAFAERHNLTLIPATTTKQEAA